MKNIFFIICTCFCFAVNAQHTLQGIIVNTENELLTGATIVLLSAADSTMVAFGLSDNAGQFSIADVEKNDYILQATYVGFANYSKALNINWKNKKIQIPDIVLEPSTELLQEVTVKAEHIPMGILGDTVVYNAAAFKTPPNANVEDLLKRLPGVEVERDGSIKAHGKDVENVLVDGKEFFGQDHRIATKNLEAEAVDKVEVFDKKSEIAEFTGIDDGQEEKTINLELKEGHKKGGFGNVAVQGGSDKRYNNKLNYFRFTPKMQASLILSGNNINEQAFSFSDQIQFMGGLGSLLSGGSFMLNSDDYDFLSREGENNAIASGVNFNYDFSKKLKLNSHYLYNHVKNDLYKSTASQNFFDDLRYDSNEDIEQLTKNNKHHINTKLTYKVSPFTEFDFKNRFQKRDNFQERTALSNYFQDGINTGITSADLLENKDRFAYESNVIYKQKFNKKGRSWISDIMYKYGNSTEDLLIDNLNTLNSNSLLINQFQEYKNTRDQFSITTNYTEPIGKKTYLSIHFNHSQDSEQPLRDYYDISAETRTLNEELSADYEKKYRHEKGGLSFKHVNKKLKLTAGIQGQLTYLDGILNAGSQSISGSYQHVLPFLRMDFDMKGGRELDFNYRTNVEAPRISDLLPLPNNANPNLEFVGNPNLRPSYNHTFRAMYRFYDQFNFVNLWASLDGMISNNRIVHRTDISEAFFRTITPVNTDKYWNAGAQAGFSSPLRALKINYNIRLRYNYADYDSYLNGQESNVKEGRTNLRLSIENRKKKHFFAETGIRLEYNTKKFAIQSDFDQQFFNTDFFAAAEAYMGKTWTIGAEYSFRKYSDESFSNAPSFNLLGASIKKLLYDEKLEISLSGYDLLGQNIGYQRITGDNSLIENNFNTLGRFVSLGLKYKIGKKKVAGLRLRWIEEDGWQSGKIIYSENKTY